MAIEGPKVQTIGVDEGEGDLSSTTGLVCLASTLNEETILQSMVEVAESQGRKATFSEAIAGLIAKTILELDLEGGLELVLPLSALINRNVRSECFRVTGWQGDAGYLVDLKKKFDYHNDPKVKMGLGLALGDLATHYAADFGGKHLNRTMKSLERIRYTLNMALSAYTAIMKIAVSSRAKIAGKIKASVPTLARNLSNIVFLLKQILGAESQTIDQLIRENRIIAGSLGSQELNLTPSGLVLPSRVLN